MKYPRAILALLVGGYCCGCSATTQYGDARVTDTSKRIVIGLPKRYWLEFPGVKLAEPATTVFHARQLPHGMGMDYWLSLRTRAAKPPAQATVSITFRDLQARPFFTRVYRFGDLSWGGESREFHSPLIPIRVGSGVIDQNKRLERAVDYEITLTVLTSSPDSRDILTLEGAGF